ncbi:HIRAN domain-containing protein [Actinoplanes couchii]|uniref:HIRAN domain-containing protein n=1 Tax=Actinoplanes couchii TaxID=403638 RepID=A0ABQ3XHV2_9ACTN|nr:HIRAN domain-containing protein [Actinoplanes couchii]MDR6317684.1 hypothetical protein [Actinoplanes couchii]GID58069.1 hypothetical protein Aco03nite_064730 [Actinoplanes couchii]
MSEPFELWGQRGWASVEAVGESHFIDAIRALFGSPVKPEGDEITVPVGLLPEPTNAHDRNAVGVWAGTGQIGYLSRRDAARFAPILAELVAQGRIPHVAARVWATTDHSGVTGSVRLHLGEPHRIVPANRPPGPPHRMMPVGAAIQVTGEERHLDTLSRWLRPEGECWVYATLHEIVENTPRSERVLVEVRIDNEVVGRLTPRMSAEVLPAMRHLAAQQMVTVTQAVVKGTQIKTEVSLYAVRAHELPESWLAAPAHSPVEAPDLPSHGPKPPATHSMAPSSAGTAGPTAPSSVAPAPPMAPDQQAAPAQQLASGQPVSADQQVVPGQPVPFVQQLGSDQQVAPGQPMSVAQQMSPSQQVGPAPHVGPAQQLAPLADPAAWSGPTTQAELVRPAASPEKPEKPDTPGSPGQPVSGAPAPVTRTSVPGEASTVRLKTSRQHSGIVPGQPTSRRSSAAEKRAPENGVPEQRMSDHRASGASETRMSDHHASDASETRMSGHHAPGAPETRVPDHRVPGASEPVVESQPAAARTARSRFNPPPNWPAPPSGWQPEAGWAPDPAWGEPPPGWQLWIEDVPDLTEPGRESAAGADAPGAEPGAVAVDMERRAAVPGVELGVVAVDAQRHAVTSGVESGVVGADAQRRAVTPGVESGVVGVDAQRRAVTPDVERRAVVPSCRAWSPEPSRCMGTSGAARWTWTSEAARWMWMEPVRNSARTARWP